MRQVWVALCVRSRSSGESRGRGLAPSGGSAGSSTLRATSLNRLKFELLPWPLQPGGFVPCPFQSDSRVHCSLRVDRCEILSAPALSQPCESSIFIKARSFKKQNDMLCLSWKNHPRRHVERKGLFLIITWELTVCLVSLLDREPDCGLDM